MPRARSNTARTRGIGDKAGAGLFFVSGLSWPNSPSEHFEKRTPGSPHRLCVFCTATPTLFCTAKQKIVSHCPSAIWKSDPHQCTTDAPLSGAAPTHGERLSFGSVVDDSVCSIIITSNPKFCPLQFGGWCGLRLHVLVPDHTGLRTALERCCCCRRVGAAHPPSRTQLPARAPAGSSTTSLSGTVAAALLEQLHF